MSNLIIWLLRITSLHFLRCLLFVILLQINRSNTKLYFEILNFKNNLLIDFFNIIINLLKEIRLFLYLLFNGLHITEIQLNWIVNFSFSAPIDQLFQHFMKLFNIFMNTDYHGKYQRFFGINYFILKLVLHVTYLVVIKHYFVWRLNVWIIPWFVYMVFNFNV